jgi:hypothetical protein
MEMKVGSFTTTSGSIAVNIETGFKIQYIKVFNDGTGASNVDSYEYLAGMTDGYAFKSVAAGTNTYATSGGPTPYSTNFFGFTMPAASCGAADVWRYVAFGLGFYEAHGDVE